MIVKKINQFLEINVLRFLQLFILFQETVEMKSLFFTLLDRLSLDSNQLCLRSFTFQIQFFYHLL